MGVLTIGQSRMLKSENHDGHTALLSKEMKHGLTCHAWQLHVNI